MVRRVVAPSWLARERHPDWRVARASRGVRPVVPSLDAAGLARDARAAVAVPAGPEARARASATESLPPVHRHHQG
ncbi:MAG TPA: hypothetical protein VF864_10990 [Gemmatimonadales bacterium]